MTSPASSPAGSARLHARELQLEVCRINIVEPVEDEWYCNVGPCNFRNFANAECCLRCGQPRPTTDGISEAIVQELHIAEQDPAIIPICSKSVDLGVCDDDGVGVSRIRYKRREEGAGLVQGRYPMAPGECFTITVHALGSFGKIGLGIGPWSSQRSQPALTDSAERDDDADAPAVRPRDREQTMVGWSRNEVGFHGDHGRFYCMGRDWKQISPPWEEGDILECGITPSGQCYFTHNGLLSAKTRGKCAISNSYPTVTMHSEGAELSIFLGCVTRKAMREFGGDGKQQQPTASELYTNFKKYSGYEQQRMQHADLTPLEKFLDKCCGVNVQAAAQEQAKSNVVVGINPV